MLYNRLEELTSESRCFAYTCKFDRDTRTRGEEKLFLSGHHPMTAYSGLKAFMARIHAMLGEGGIMPLFIGYDSVSEIYRLPGIKRSAWPMVAAIIPESVITDDFSRDRYPEARTVKPSSSGDSALRKKIEEARNRIVSGELLQVVLSRRFKVREPDMQSLLQYFMENDRSLFVYHYRFGDYEIVGSSPENIVTRSGQTLEVHPIAGTTPRGSDDLHDRKLADTMLNDPKELREHRMLVDLARNDLGMISVPGSVRVDKSMEIQKFSSVQHIVSTVNSTLRNGMGNYDVIRSVFPAGTVSGAPKIRAMTLIDQYEDSARGPYAGGVGTISRDSIELALLIRSLYRDSGGAFTQAGAGIVMDSDPEKEVNEIFSKAETVMGGVKSESIDH